MNDTPLALPKDTSVAAPSKPSPVVIEYGPVRPVHTGYARIDNAITDALRGKSQELKDSRGSFMDAMRSIAKIGMEGKRVGSCKMEYQVKHAIGLDGNGYVHEDSRGEVRYAMEMYDTESYAEYQKMLNASGEDTGESAMFLMRWMLKNIDLVVAGRPGYQKYQDEQYEKLYQVKLDRTFSGTDKSSKDSFLSSIKEKLNANRNLQIDMFMEQISQMAKAPGGYLLGRRMVLTGRA